MSSIKVWQIWRDVVSSVWPEWAKYQPSFTLEFLLMCRPDKSFQTKSIMTENPSSSHKRWGVSLRNKRTPLFLQLIYPESLLILNQYKIHSFVSLDGEGKSDICLILKKCSWCKQLYWCFHFFPKECRQLQPFFFGEFHCWIAEHNVTLFQAWCVF